MSSTNDLRYALRRLRRSPVFTVATVASLAIGIGAATAIFSIDEALLLRPLPGIATPDRLVDIGRTEHGRGFDTFGYPDLVDFAADARTLDEVFGYRIDPFLVRVDERTEQVLGYAVSASYFAAMGVRPELGRTFRDDEDTPQGGAPVAMVSDAYFQRALGGDPARIGSLLRVNGRSLTVVGVTPPAFHGHIFGLRPAVYVPLSTPLSDDPWQREKLRSRDSVWLHVGGRLAPGATLAAARTELAAIGVRLAETYPESHADRGVAVVAYRPIPGPGRLPVGIFSAILFALVGLVLLIACVNVASMLLARAEERRREIAVRRALGAARTRIVRQLVVESAVLFALAVPVALLLARWGVSLLAALRPPTPFPVALEFPIDWWAGGFALVVALVTGILFGLAPAVRAARSDPQAALHDGSAGVGTRHLRLRRGLVACQLALSLLLLVAAGLFLRAVWTAQRIDPGFVPEGVVAYEFDFELAGYDAVRSHAALAELVERARDLPGVRGASSARIVPLDLSRLSLGAVSVPGDATASAEGVELDADVVSPGFFSTLGIPLAGRDFDARDRLGSARVAIVNRSFERRYFPDGALARTFEMAEGAGAKNAYRIVGVAGDIRTHDLGEAAAPFYWVPAAQWPVRKPSLMVRAAGDPDTVTAEVRALAQRLDSDLPAGPARPLVEVAATSTLPQRLAAWVAGSVGIVGLLLAAVGVYGIMAFAVAARQRELAVRRALGAQNRDVVRFVLADAARPVAAGVVVGLLLSAALSRLLSSLLFGLSPTDALTFLAVTATLLAVAVLALVVPCRRALAADPAVSLRSE